MFNTHRLVAILCLALLAGTVLSVSAKLDILWVLPVLAILPVGLLWSPVQKFTEPCWYLPVLPFSSVSLRAPPNN